MKKSSRASLTTKYIVLFGVLMMLANILLGYLMLRQSSAVVQSLIRKSMLNISNTAAELIDGDALGALTEDDVGGVVFNDILHDLAAFQNNADIEFIYAVRQVGPDTFVFTVDPDPVEPGQFGEEVLVTDALRQAGRGVATVDDAPAEDRWGNFYSSYSPVFDSNHKVAGIIGVDFDASWYDEQVWRNTYSMVLFSVLFTVVGALAFFLFSRRIRKGFEELNAELVTLSNDVEALTQELLANPGFKEASEAAPLPEPESVAGDELAVLSGKLHHMHAEMERYLDYMHAQVNTDGLTKVGNTTAYLERQKALDAKILDGTAAFSAAMFDINYLKLINDRYGHACGDRVILAAASFISACFGVENTYRIGGDEFIAIAENLTSEEMEQRLASIDQATDAYNRGDAQNEAALSLSRGHASFQPGVDHSFRDVFLRADAHLYSRKDSYHRRNDPSAV